MDIVRQLLGVALVLGLLTAALWWLRRKGMAQFGAARMTLGRGGRGRLLEVIESRPLAPGHALHLVRVAGRGLVLAIHPGGCTTVDSRAWHEFSEHQEAGR